MEEISKITIREFREQDKQAIKDLLLVLQDYVNKLEPKIIATGEQVYESYFNYFLKEVSEKNGKIYVAHQDERIVGFVGCFFTKETYEQTECLYISDLVVLEEYRGQGLGKEMLSYVENYGKSRGAKLLKISALAKNTNALSLYRKMGFEDYSIVLLKDL